MITAPVPVDIVGRPIMGGSIVPSVLQSKDRKLKALTSAVLARVWAVDYGGMYTAML